MLFLHGADINDSNEGKEVIGISLYASLFRLRANDEKYSLNLFAITRLQIILSLSIMNDALMLFLTLPLKLFIISQVFFLLPLFLSNDSR